MFLPLPSLTHLPPIYLTHPFHITHGTLADWHFIPQIQTFSSPMIVQPDRSYSSLTSISLNYPTPFVGEEPVYTMKVVNATDAQGRNMSSRFYMSGQQLWMSSQFAYSDATVTVYVQVYDQHTACIMPTQTLNGPCANTTKIMFGVVALSPCPSMIRLTTPVGTSRLINIVTPSAISLASELNLNLLVVQSNQSSSATYAAGNYTLGFWIIATPENLVCNIPVR